MLGTVVLPCKSLPPTASHAPSAVDVALHDAELSLRVGAPPCDALWSPWSVSTALDAHVKAVRLSLCVALSLVATSGVRRCELLSSTFFGLSLSRVSRC